MRGPTTGTPENLPDGVLVTGGDVTRNHVVTWTVLVSLGAPREEPGLLEKLREFRETLRSYHELNALSITEGFEFSIFTLLSAAIICFQPDATFCQFYTRVSGTIEAGVRRNTNTKNSDAIT